VLVGCSVSGSAGRWSRAVSRGRGVGAGGSFMLEEILHEADGRVDISHRGRDEFLGETIGDIVSVERCCQLGLGQETC
jgi:hypothetical protein